jgi:4-carboxymuconolactone decarboxylase
MSDPTGDGDLYEEGLAIRRAVLGDDHVDMSLAAINGFTEPLQQLVTEYCWGRIWGRTDLDRKSRSLVNLGMLAALNRPEELKLHVRGALNNGCSVGEIREVLLQTAVYCGIPAAIDAFRKAEEVLFEDKEDKATANRSDENPANTR